MRQFYGRALVVGGPLLLMLSLLGSIWQTGGLYGVSLMVQDVSLTMCDEEALAAVHA